MISKVSASSSVCCIIGNPVKHSLSPLLHNAGYQSLGLDFIYVAFEVHVNALPQALVGLKNLGIRGASVTMPFKEVVIPYLDSIDPLAAKVGAVNTIVNSAGILVGHNTDCAGVQAPLRLLLEARGEHLRVAILGAGGAAKAAACAVAEYGALPLVFARNVGRASELANVVQGQAYELGDQATLASCDVIINATPIGMQEHPGCPVDLNFLRPDQVVFDMIYKPRETELIRAASDRGCQVITGLDMLIHQALEQFCLFTGQRVDEEVFRGVLDLAR